MASSSAVRSAPHRPVSSVDTCPVEWDAFVGAGRLRRSASDHDLVATADRVGGLLPPAVRAALDAHTAGTGIGALVVHGVPTGPVPPTPTSPTAPTAIDHLSELVLLSVARTLGEPVGYLPEHGGALVQNLLPTRHDAHRQTSTSSAVELEFHTETMFHPHRPHHLLLLCLRGDPAARTLLCAIDELLADLEPPVRSVLHQPRFRTRVDESFGGSPDDSPGPPISVLSGDPAHPSLLFDAELMTADDADAAAALDALRTLARRRRVGIVLEPGDLLVIDNRRCIHGRSAFVARHDGTDRWLQRSFVVDDLAPSAGERDGRIITTSFA